MQEIKKELINAETCLVGVIGSPINHSLSPIIHNAVFKELNLNWCYLGIPCETNNLELVLKALRLINCKGLNITIPHKNNAIKYCNEINSIAKVVNAVNTLVPNEYGGWKGFNTDIEGFLEPLRKNNMKNIKKVIIIGTGGSAKAVLFGLKSLNISEITIISRKSTSIHNIINSININCDENIDINGLISDDLSKIKEKIEEANLIINATPIGMFNKSNDTYLNEVPLGEDIWQHLTPNTILYDLIYTPRPTKWLKIGKKHGCRSIDGLEMLINQGAASLKIWSGIQEIPVNIMRNAAEKALQH